MGGRSQAPAALFVVVVLVVLVVLQVLLRVFSVLLELAVALLRLPLLALLLLHLHVHLFHGCELALQLLERFACCACWSLGAPENTFGCICV